MTEVRPEIEIEIKRIRYTYNTKDQVEALNKYLFQSKPLPDDNSTLPNCLQGLNFIEYQKLFQVYWILYYNIIEIDEDTESKYYS